MVLDQNRTDNWDNIGTATTSKTGTPVVNQNGYKDSQHQHLKLINANNLGNVALASPVQMLEIERLATDSWNNSSNDGRSMCHQLESINYGIDIRRSIKIK